MNIIIQIVLVFIYEESLRKIVIEKLKEKADIYSFKENAVNE